MVAGPKSPVTSVAGLIAYAKVHLGKLNFGVPNGAPPHMLAAWFKDLTKTDFVMVTYRGGANVLSDLMGGQIDMAVETSARSCYLTCVTARCVRLERRRRNG